ncbi:MAG: alanine racemase [Eubacteriales bacterium]|nr:alanine racemase [Eubacteriales bacterium]
MEKYGRVYAEINLNRILENIESIRLHIGDSKLMAVIKADGYGHGATVCAKHMADVVDYYAVATIDEALDLMNSFVEKPILVLGGVFERSIPELIQKGIRTTVFYYEMAKKLSEYAVLMNRPCYIHIKLDTGMSRIGYATDEHLEEEMRKIAALPNLVVEGVFTHFANADEADKTPVRAQYDRFEAALSVLERVGISVPLVHCANSAAVIDMPSAHRDMVRAGIILYGYYPSTDVLVNHVPVKPALQLKSHIIFTKEIPPGTGVGYNSTFVSERPMRIATIPVGYADGYPRSLSNCGYVLIRGRRANIIGRVCMDQFMVDVTDFGPLDINEEVVLIGRSGTEEVTLEELARLSGKFNYEFVCGLSKRIPRLYFKDGQLVDEVNFFYTARRV